MGALVISEGEKRLIRWHLYVAYIAIAVGIFFGLLQALSRAKLLPPMPWFDYYQGLTFHGVLNALVWTTFNIVGLLAVAVRASLGRPLYSLSLGWTGFGLMTIGVAAAGYAILTRQANVLYTFYPPLMAHPAFYIGATLLIVGSWISGANLILTYVAWRRENPGQRTPLMTFGSITVFVLWYIATLGVAIEVLFLLLPWSLGLVKQTNPMLARTLFWYFGHPLVYFWLLPAYVVWYTMVPRLAGGKLYSDPMARLAFLMLLIFSTPIGLHHQYADPAVGQEWKLVHAFGTFMVAIPSLLTAFNLMASLEYAGRQRGGRGLIDWIFRLPWNEPAFAGSTLAMIAFIFGGISGIVNASYNVNLVVHNTSWVPGHLHLTVGTAVTLTFMATATWMVPYLTGRALWSHKVALANMYLWFVGVMIFAVGMMRGGLEGEPRRTNLGFSPYLLPEWMPFLIMAAIGGALMFIAGTLFLLNMAMTIWFSRQPARVEVPISEALHTAADAPLAFERWRVWLAVAAVLIVIAYAPVITQVLQTSPFSAYGFLPSSPSPIR
ncbi:MAG: b(o/a)3-type cytochrome-c oxidase subunit 1 [Anaerolineae bacterium]|uniref:b(o/a)3-type cytochrome-c oxidase subunit 1 n=1 Tax=Thermoflexus sp. TaxID=1969742 RepID=UPI0025F73708|nr:b(o/a)3-type cytochrome-c oxidase subunit 1 [Thermoflexus sp.]MCS7350861.1 b(o/a)3-type cytochrome-c oxidase subunit 1 [Thermoflexus sp.]MDW8180312.1 b(o/a)3-type cytochrome-c oxidase subunit 1 [Anaerolineae bacterium]